MFGIGEWREINYTCSICFNTAGHINKSPRFGVIIKRRAGEGDWALNVMWCLLLAQRYFNVLFARFAFFARQHTHPVTFLSCLNNKKHKRSEWSPLHQMWNYFHWVKKRCETRNREFGGVRGWHHISRGFPAMFSVCQEKKRRCESEHNKIYSVINYLCPGVPFPLLRFEHALKSVVDYQIFVILSLRPLSPEALFMNWH